MPAVRVALFAFGKPYVIENVPGCPLLDPVMLCGSMFGLGADFPPHGRMELRRHRLFESSLPLSAPGPCAHRYTALRVFGHGRPGNSALTGPGYARASRDAMGTAWMGREALDEAIPPAYTEHIGQQALGLTPRPYPAGLHSPQPWPARLDEDPEAGRIREPRRHLTDPVPLRQVLTEPGEVADLVTAARMHGLVHRPNNLSANPVQPAGGDHGQAAH
ncbi:MAG: hypothetical protein WAK82_45040 [Streptosporangiaceae bacterium]